MLSFFRSNNPLVVIGYLLYLVAFRVCLWFVPVDTAFVFEHREPLATLVTVPLQHLAQSYTVVSAVLAAALCFIQALLVNGIVNSNKIAAKKNYSAGILYILFVSLVKENLLLTPALLSLTFVILATSRLFGLTKNEKLYGDVFDVGFLLAIAGLFYFPAMLFILYGYIGLAIIRPFNYRDWTILLLGFLSPVFVVFTYYFWFDRQGAFIADVINQHTGWLVMPAFGLPYRIVLGGLALSMVAGLVLLPAALYSSLIQVRKFANALVVLIVLILVSVAMLQSVQFSHLTLLALPMGIITSLVLGQIKSTMVSEVSHLILILLVLTGQYLQVLNLF